MIHDLGISWQPFCDDSAIYFSPTMYLSLFLSYPHGSLFQSIPLSVSDFLFSLFLSFSLLFSPLFCLSYCFSSLLRSVSLSACCSVVVQFFLMNLTHSMKPWKERLNGSPTKPSLLLTLGKCLTVFLLSACLSLSGYLSVFLSAHLSTHQSVCLPVSLSI